MIKSFKHGGLKRLYERGDRSGIGADMLDTVQNILTILDVATSERALAPALSSPSAQGREEGIHEGYRDNVVNERAGISPEMAIRLSKAFGSTAETWLAMQAAFDLAVVRKHEGRIKVKRLQGGPPAAAA